MLSQTTWGQEGTAHPSDTPAILAKRVLEIEHRLYPEELKLLASEKVTLKDGLAVFS